MGAENILGRRISDQSAERMAQIALLTELRNNLKVILENGPKVADQGFRARQYYVALEQAEKIVGHVVMSMNKGAR